MSTILDWQNEADVRRFLVNLRVAIDDADAVTLDMLRPLRRRRLGHAECRRLHDEAADKLGALLTYAGLSTPDSDGH